MYEIVLTERTVGYVVSSARSGETVQVQQRGATSTEDGDLHIKYLEGFPQSVLSLLPDEIKPSDIKSLVVIISNDLNARVYLNELDVLGSAILKAKEVEKGQIITRNDIIGFDKIQLGGISFPKNCAYICILSIGWDTAYLFDFGPLGNQENSELDYEVEKYIGSYISYLIFKSIHKITDEEWDEFMNQNWFPFHALRFETIEKAIEHIKSGWKIDEIIEVIQEDLQNFLEEFLHDWSLNLELSPYTDFLNKAWERHLVGDYVSSISILYPQIEGLLRMDFIKENPTKSGRRQDALLNHVTAKMDGNSIVLTTYLPERFRTFLEECYFNDFISCSIENNISRHSVAHGASSIEKFNQKESLLGFLIFSQIAQYITHPH